MGSIMVQAGRLNQLGYFVCKGNDLKEKGTQHSSELNFDIKKPKTFISTEHNPDFSRGDFVIPEQHVPMYIWDRESTKENNIFLL